MCVCCVVGGVLCCVWVVVLCVVCGWWVGMLCCGCALCVWVCSCCVAGVGVRMVWRVLCCGLPLKRERERKRFRNRARTVDGFASCELCKVVCPRGVSTNAAAVCFGKDMVEKSLIES